MRTKRAATMNDTDSFQLQPMELPPEYKTSGPRELPDGCETTTHEVWQMLVATRDGDLAAVRRMVEGCPGLVHATYNYTPPIHFAVREGHAELVRFLLEQGADPRYKTYRYRDSLRLMASDRGYGQIVAILDSAAPSLELADGFTDLIEAISQDDVGSVAAQLEARPDLITATDENGTTALHSASDVGGTEIVTLLLDRGADIQATDDAGFKPIHSAIYNSAGNVPDRMPVTHTLRSGRMAGLLLQRGATSNIALAATFADMRAVRQYLEGDPSLANFEDTSTIEESKTAHHRPLLAAVKRNDVEMARLLLSHGADAREPDDRNFSHAVIRGHVEIARLLLEHGASLADITLNRAGSNQEMHDLLTEYGARQAPIDRVIMSAVSADDLEKVEALLEEHPDVTPDPATFWGEGILAQPARDRQLEMMELLFKHGARVPDVTKWGISYYFRHPDIARMMMERGMNPNHMNWHRTTLLHDVAASGYLDRARLLLGYGADIDPVDEEYRSTPLGLAARAGRVEMVELLLREGAAPDKAGAPWATPLNWARRRGHEEIASLLEGRM